MKNPYEVLDVSHDAKLNEIKKAYRTKAKQYHPDLNPGDEEAAEKFKELSEAYAILSDEEKRRQYDTYGAAAFENGGMGSGFNVDFDDIFGDIFGGMFGGRRARRNDPNAPKKGQDMRIRMKLTFQEAVFGTTKKINITREQDCEHCHGTGAKEGTGRKTCPTCNGRGSVQKRVNSLFGVMIQESVCPQCHGEGSIVEEACSYCHGTGREKVKTQVEITIPAGVDEGNIIPLSGQGHGGAKGGPNGDLYVVVSVEPSDIFERHGNDLYFELPITFVQAALGDEVKVPTLECAKPFTIPEGTQSGTRFTLKGEGVSDVRTGRKGNIYFTANVVTPTKLTEEQKDTLRKFGKQMGEKTTEREKNFFEKVKDLFD